MHDPEPQRVGDPLEDRPVGRGRLVAADRVLRGLLDRSQHRGQLHGLDRLAAALRVEVRMPGIAVVKELVAQAAQRGAEALSDLGPRLHPRVEAEHVGIGARAEVLVLRAGDPVGPLDRVTQPGGERGPPAVELEPGVVPVFRGQVGSQILQHPRPQHV